MLSIQRRAVRRRCRQHRRCAFALRSRGKIARDRCSLRDDARCLGGIAQVVSIAPMSRIRRLEYMTPTNEPCFLGDGTGLRNSSRHHMKLRLYHRRLPARNPAQRLAYSIQRRDFSVRAYCRLGGALP
ncbi:hypothetical protein OH77DRAFT_1226322 [Trametes cingulata]|nr:hypothetical protein OH77DRAFT_1226322 [Trametes cingulata]